MASFLLTLEKFLLYSSLAFITNFKRHPRAKFLLVCRTQSSFKVDIFD